MDIFAIILTIAACLAGLFLLYVIVMGGIFFFASKRVTKGLEASARSLGTRASRPNYPFGR